MHPPRVVGEGTSPLAHASSNPLRDVDMATDVVCLAGSRPLALRPEYASQYYRARYYDPKVGRFISEDPIGLAGSICMSTFAATQRAGWIRAVAESP